MILDRIKAHFEDLTPAQKKAAFYISNHIDTVAFLSAKEIGARSDCSEPTIHRLAKEIGYDNYMDMSQEIKEYALTQRVLTRLDNLIDSDIADKDSGIQDHLVKEIDNLNRTMLQVRNEQIMNAVDLILKANRIYIAGWRAQLAVTSQLSYLLNYILGNTLLIPQGEAAEYSNYITGRDLLIAAGYPRYCKTTLQLCKAAKMQNIPIISFTDSELSPFYKLADQTFIAETETNGMIDSFIAPLSIVNLLINQVAYRKSDLIKVNVRNMEDKFALFDLKFDWHKDL